MCWTHKERGIPHPLRLFQTATDLYQLFNSFPLSFALPPAALTVPLCLIAGFPLALIVPLDPALIQVSVPPNPLEPISLRQPNWISLALK